MMRRTLVVMWLMTGSVVAVQPARAEWDPEAFRDEGTLEIRTVAEGKKPHWFKVWLVVIDGEVYVRLGNRATDRIQSNTTRPFIGIRIAGRQFDRVLAEEAPPMADRVAAAMAEKYWSDCFVRWLPHPLTLRLVPEAETVALFEGIGALYPKGSPRVGSRSLAVEFPGLDWHALGTAHAACVRKGSERVREGHS